MASSWRDLKCACFGGPDLITDEHANTTYCQGCAQTFETNAIVSETTFAESSNGRSIATGVYTAADDTGALSQLGRRGAGRESRQITLANGTRRIESVANGMGLGASEKDQATRLFNLAVSNSFVQGRRTDYVVAACLYIACRLKEDSTCMLIDFSDLLKVNVFVLGATFLKLVRALNMSEKLKATDPAHLIQRFAALLDFGDETQKVASDAVRLMKRFQRDWMAEGRRPAGICGACLLLASRMNNFRRSIDEIVQVVKIADVTVRKRLEEFKSTPSGQLSVEQFRTCWLEESADPPSFVEGQRKERERTEKAEAMSLAGTPRPAKRRRESSSTPGPSKVGGSVAMTTYSPGDDDDAAEAGAIESELKTTLTSVEGQAVTDELDAKERAAEEERRRVEAAQQVEVEEFDALDDLDEEELGTFILTDAERAMKERLWVLNNKDYLETLAEKHLRGDADEPRKRRKRRKPAAPRDSTTASAATAADATRQLLVKKKISRKLDYSVFDTLFDEPGEVVGTRSASPASRNGDDDEDSDVDEDDDA